jgi:hypothetical protein
VSGQQSRAYAAFTPVTQTRFYEPDAPPDKQRGNCLTAVVASLLHLPIEAVPNFAQDDVDSNGERNWWYSMWTFVHEQDAHIVLLRDEHQPDSAWPLPEPGEPYTVSGVSPRDPRIHHIVIYRDGVMVHDPHPDRTGLVTEDGEYRWTIRPGAAPADRGDEGQVGETP